MHVSRVRAKGEAEQAALDFSRLTRAPGPGTYPLQVQLLQVGTLCTRRRSKQAKDVLWIYCPAKHAYTDARRQRDGELPVKSVSPRCPFTPCKGCQTNEAPIRSRRRRRLGGSLPPTPRAPVIATRKQRRSSSEWQYTSRTL